MSHPAAPAGLPAEYLAPGDEGHRDRVKAVAAQVRNHPPGVRLTIRKGTPSHGVRATGYKRHAQAVDVSALHHLLQIDPQGLTATVEGPLLMGHLCRETLALGLMPQVVPEYPTFTVAGLVNGEGLQSSSHRYGAFSHTITALEVVLGDGSVVVATPDQHPDLFSALPGSLGTLGIVTAATLRLMPGAPYVRSTYTPFRSLDDYVDAFLAALDRQTFLEGVVFGPRSYLLVTAELAPDPGGAPLRSPELPGEPYYFQHLRAVAAGLAPQADAMETRAYLSRPVRGMWWMVECYTDFPLLSETGWGRRLLDRRTAELFARHGFAPQGLTVLERERCLVHQDMGVTAGRLRDELAWVQTNLAVYPIWNCAIKVPDAAQATIGARHVVDLGIYGEPGVRPYRCAETMRALQRRVDLPSLWGVSYLTPDELHAARIVDFERYERARQEYHATGAFPHLDEKVLWIDPAAPLEGKIPLWRLYRSFGPRWRRKPHAYAALLLGAASKAVFGAWWQLRVLLARRRRQPGGP